MIVEFFLLEIFFIELSKLIKFVEFAEEIERKLVMRQEKIVAVLAS